MSNLTSSQLQQQILALQEQQRQLSQSPKVANIPTDLNYLTQVQGMIKEVVATELADMRKLLEGLVKPTEPKIVQEKVNELPKKELTILEAVGLALTNEEQLWLSKKEVLSRLPDFLSSKSGLEFTKMLVTDLKEFINAD